MPETYRRCPICHTITPRPVCAQNAAHVLEALTPEQETRVAAELKRRQKNARARARYDAYRSLGMVRTPYGWE